ncbi:ATP-binding protein [Lacisediminimonas profundi]|uniref:ATP-binding protein n=1 Tax=Lacisediminimonas profundi TaxID=2603856 RepID=UPI00138745EC|nr:YhaN family protein [Lacisediminimonas profundi]
MRLNTLELIRYGKFAGETLELPGAEHDFHFIVGPNEAGKSTIRAAIADLLFGIPARSTHAFRHELSQLRLGAVARHEQVELSFERAKANKSTLRDRADQPLPDAALQELLGNADKSFFEQMFALDHQSLIKGGQDILNASSNLGQILFQSAAGIDSLGRIHQALADEAEAIWTPRKAAGRKYYAAADLYEQALKELKEATVRPKEWTDAAQALAEVEARLAEEKQNYERLEIKRSQLERIRRTGPDLAFLKNLEADLEADLQQHGPVLEFAEDAAARLRSAQDELARAQPALKIHCDQVDALKQELDKIVINARLLQSASEIQDLEEMRQKYSNYERDLPARQKEVENLLAGAAALAAQLGWPQDEPGLRAALPGTLDLSQVSDLVKTRGVIAAADESARRTADKKSLELDRMQAELDAIHAVQVAPGLEAALLEAQTWRQVDAGLRKLHDAVTSASTELDLRLRALGQWQQSADELRAMPLPAEDRVARLGAERQNITIEIRNARKNLADAEARAEATALEITQFRQARHLVSSAEVSDARSKRDHAWVRLKSGQISLEAGAPAVDEGIHLSDQLVDSQLGSVSESAELLSLQQRHQRELQAVQQLQKAIVDIESALARLEHEWAGLCAQAGLAGMSLDDIQSWLARREVALNAANMLEAKQADLADQQRLSGAAFDALRAELRKSAAQGAADANAHANVNANANASVLDLLTQASQHVTSAQEARLRRNALSAQIDKGKADLLDLQRQADDSRAQLTAWDQRWDKALATVKLERFRESIKTVDDAVALIGQIKGNLDKASTIHQERIDPMRADLASFAAVASALAHDLASDLASDLQAQDPSLIAKQLNARLQTEQAASKEATRIGEELAKARQQVKDAEEKVAIARLNLAPMFELAGVKETEALAQMIKRSDRKRELDRAIESVKGRLTANSDALPLAQIASEVQAQDISAVPSRLQSVMDESRLSREAQAALNEKHLVARQALEAISGSADAATAEARRQEALSEMAQACERYIKVATAGKLLKWAIDRYRDRKQGPLLARAGEIFRGLTLGGFRKLEVDFETQPYALAARRETGELVGIPGMSEGTRDQLFLALRLAALELHLGQATPLPFIADDLFVNFDDERTKAGLLALRELSVKTQVIFLSHHDHMVGMVKEVFGEKVNVVDAEGIIRRATI